MPNLVIKMMMSYLMTAEQATLSVRESEITRHCSFLILLNVMNLQLHGCIGKLKESIQYFIYILKVKLYRNDFTKEY